MSSEFFRVAHTSRVLAMASRHRGLFVRRTHVGKSLFRRDACATQSTGPRANV
jgi:hypothetical protein